MGERGVLLCTTRTDGKTDWEGAGTPFTFLGFCTYGASRGGKEHCATCIGKEA